MPDPRYSNPELFDISDPDAPIPQLVNAMRMAGIEIEPQSVAEGIAYQKMGKDGNSAVVVVYHRNTDLTKQGETLEGPIPLIFARQNENRWWWEKVRMRDLGDLSGIKLGSWFPWDSPDRVYSIYEEELHSATLDTGVYWPEVEPRQGYFDFDRLRKNAGRAQTSGYLLRGHALVFPSVSPEWLQNSNYSIEEMTQILINHVQRVVSYSQELGINEWVVVNEPYLSPYRTDDPFYRALGNYDYITVAFQAARDANPSARLIYNDTDNHYSGGLTTSLTRQMVSRLREQGLIDAVGVQAHLGDWVPLPTTERDKQDIIRTLVGYGLPVVVTELDVNLHNVSGTQEERYMLQAEVYQIFIDAALQAGVTEISFWGIDEGNSWLEVWSGQFDADATLFDRNLNPKPAYYAITQLLLSRSMLSQ